MEGAPGGVGEPPPEDERPHRDERGDPDRALPVPGGAVARLPPDPRTSGRAEPVDRTPEIEAQVLTTALGASARLFFEQRDIVALCTTTRSVAEVAATLGLHIGVARVLVADLAAPGHLVVERPSAAPLSQDRNVMGRVVRGLTAIR